MVESLGVVSEAVESDLPSGVPFDAGVKFIYIVGIVPNSPFYAENVDSSVGLLNGLLLIFPGLDLERFEAVILLVFVLVSVENDLVPGVLDGLVLPADLPQEVSEVDLGLSVVGL